MPSPHCIRPAPRPRALSRPHFRGHRGAGRPFRADRDADQEAQHRERNPIPGECGQAGSQRIGEDREDHGAPAADIVGQHAADHPADAPAEQRDADHGAGIGRDLGELRWQQAGRAAPRRPSGSARKSRSRRTSSQGSRQTWFSIGSRSRLRYHGCEPAKVAVDMGLSLPQGRVLDQPVEPALVVTRGHFDRIYDLWIGGTAA